MDFDKLQIAKAYISARKLNPNAAKVWEQAILKYVDPALVHSVLDLGCGTGRFIPFLQELFPSAKIIGIDPSKEMLAEAKNALVDSSVGLIEGAAEDIPVKDGSVDLVFMVMVYHTLEDKQKAVTEIKRILKSQGHVVIKQIVKEANRKHSFFDFFPEALLIAQNLVPARKEVIREFSEQGFVFIENQLLSYERAKNWGEYFDTIKHRGISVLKLLPDEVFEKDLKGFKRFCQNHGSEGPVMDSRDLFVFLKP